MSILALAWAFPMPIKGPQKAVLVALAHHADDDGNCWPSVRRLALLAGCCERVVRTSIRSLQGLSLVDVSPVEGRRNNYRLSLTTAYGAVVELDTPLQQVPHTPASHTDTPASHVYIPAPNAGDPGISRPLIVNEQPKKNQRKVNELSVRPTADLDYELFWNLYPRKKEGRSAALAPWQKALKRATANQIIEGVRRYPFNPEYLPMASTWLNQARWETEANTPPPTAERPVNGKQVFRNGAMEALRLMAEEGVLIDTEGREVGIFAGLFSSD